MFFFFLLSIGCDLGRISCLFVRVTFKSPEINLILVPAHDIQSLPIHSYFLANFNNEKYTYLKCAVQGGAAKKNGEQQALYYYDICPAFNGQKLQRGF